MYGLQLQAVILMNQLAKWVLVFFCLKQFQFSFNISNKLNKVSQ